MIKSIVEKIRNGWSNPKYGFHHGRTTPFKMKCFFEESKMNLGNEFAFIIPNDLRDFWINYNSAILFQDIEFGQWGLHIFSPFDALNTTIKEKKSRPNDFSENDLVIGEFLGDSDLLVISCDTQNKYGQIKIALPIDPNGEWYTAANSFSEFIDKYSQVDGAKYWE